MEDKQKKSEAKKVLTNKDILESQGLVEIYDPAVGAYRQVPKEEAEKMARYQAEREAENK